MSKICQNTAPLPILYTKKENCCGCSACCANCPQGAITMKADEEGFLYPGISRELCIRCYRCLAVCVFKEDQKRKGFMFKV